MSGTPKRTSKIVELIEREEKVKSIVDLSIQGSALFHLLILITDIKYRQLYGEDDISQSERGYSYMEEFVDD